jgi:tripartite-type tricarboxylate transporter receptor subunit TctC
MLLTRREAMAGFGGALVLQVLPAAAEAAYPNRPIKMVVPYPAGGTTDLLGRVKSSQQSAVHD